MDLTKVTPRSGPVSTPFGGLRPGIAIALWPRMLTNRTGNHALLLRCLILGAGLALVPSRVWAQVEKLAPLPTSSAGRAGGPCQQVPGVPSARACDGGLICEQETCVPDPDPGPRLVLNERPVVTDPALYAHGRRLRGAGITLTLLGGLINAAGVAIWLYYRSLPPPSAQECWCKDIGYGLAYSWLLVGSLPLLGAGIPLWGYGASLIGQAEARPTGSHVSPYLWPTSGGVVAGLQVTSF
jgi:hypothetical protein